MQLRRSGSKSGPAWSLLALALLATVIVLDSSSRATSDVGIAAPADRRAGRLASIEASSTISARSTPEERDPASASPATDPDRRSLAVEGPGDLGEVALEPAGALRVTVVSPEGTPRSGASVSVMGDSGDGELRLVCEYTTGDDGTVMVATVPGPMQMWAGSGSQRSVPWRSEARRPESIRLELAPTFDAHGGVAFAPSQSPSEPRATVRAFTSGASRTELASVGVSESGAWSLQGLPVLESGACVFRLEGRGIATHEELAVGVTPGADLAVDFDALPACTFPVSVEEYDHSPVEDARVAVRWMAGTRWVTTEHTTGADGAALVDSVPAGDVWIDISADGLASAGFGPFHAPADVRAGLTLYVGRAGRIVGTCQQEGQPVTTFTLRYWQDQPWNVRELEIAGRPDGSFEIDDAPLGNVQIVASSPACPSSEVHSVLVAPDAPARAAIHLEPVGRAMGRVIDAATGEPIPTATVQLWQLSGSDRIGRWSEPVSVDALGDLRDVILSTAWSELDIGAPGYASVSRSARADPGAAFDCGTIALVRKQELVVRLQGQAGVDSSAYEVDLGYGEQHPAVTFDAQGIARFEEVDPGPVAVSIYPPEFGRLTFQYVLETGREWVLDVPLDTGRSLSVRVEREGDEPLQEGMWVGLSYSARPDREMQCFQSLPPDGKVTFVGLEGSAAVVEVVGPDFGKLAVRCVDLAAEGATDAVLRLDPTRRTIRFVDRSRQPLANTAVQVRTPGNPTGWGVTQVTDNAGVIVLEGLQMRSAAAYVSTPEFYANDVPIPLDGPRNETVEVVIDVAGHFDLQLVDGDVALAGVGAALSRELEGLTLIRSVSDPRGHVEFDSLTPGSYQVRVDAPGYWRAQIGVDARVDSPRYVLQVRRLGTIRFAIESAGFSPAGARLELVSDEYGESVSDWLAAARISSSSGSMATDADGVLVLYGLPHGEYSWRMEDPGGRVVEGRAQVLPQDVQQVRVGIAY